MAACSCCGGKMEPDAVGACRKFVDRNMTEFLCLACLADELRCTVPYLEERIAFLRRNGCSFFPKETE